MFLTPSGAIGHIDSEKVKVNIRFELLRFIAQTLVKMNLTEEDYLADNPSAKLTKGSTVHYTLASDYGIENVETCLDAIKMLERFEKGWRKPSEKTINSTSLSSCAKLSSTTVLQMPTSKSNSSVILQQLTR